jgi:Tol biopolymer transport system component
LTRARQRLFAGTLIVLGSLVPLRPLAAQYGTGPQWQGQGFGKNKIQYRDFDWSIYHSPHFNVYYYPAEEPLLQKVVSFAESAYDQLSREFNFQIQDPIPLVFYATHSAFEQTNVILNFIPEGTGAFATPARFRMVLPVDLPDPKLMELLLHELTHIFQFHILFQGSLAKAVTAGPPQWLMEGMASYMAKDEDAREYMYLRDAVVNDRIPSVTRGNPQGFFAYRLGHAVFDFIEERWGKEGFRDFIYEIRNTLGFQVDRAVERAFKLDAEEFDGEFRRWLRRKYLPELIQTGEPGDFGKIFRLGEQRTTETETSPAASPSGDLVASFSYYQGDLDVVLFDAEKRQLIRNLTKGYSNEYQYLVAQELALGRAMGRDLAFSPDRNSIAVFAKREKGRSLVLLDVLNGGIRRIIDDLGGIEQQLAPAWSPDGKKIAFYGHKDGKFDIFTYDLETGAIANLTHDEVYDGAPVYSPDGKSIVFASVMGNGFAKLFRMDLDQPGQRFQLTTGESNENDPTFSPDGQRLYFTSDRDGLQNIYSLDLASGEIRQYTNVVTGAFMPTVLREPDGEERVVYTGFWKGEFGLYVAEIDEPVTEPQKIELPVEPTQAADLPPFEPDIQVTLDDANKEKYGGFKFFLEDAQTFVAVDDNQNYLGQVYLSFSDYLGDKRLIGIFSSLASFSNFDVIYADLSERLQWQVHLFDDRSFFFAEDTIRPGEFIRGRAIFKQTGAVASIVYPFTFYQRFEAGAGYVFREFLQQTITFNPETGFFEPDLIPIDDDFPLFTGALVGDSSRFAPWGPVAGRRWRLDTFYAPDLDDSGTLLMSADLDFRQYLQVSQRSNLAFRAFYGWADGNSPNPFYFGGLDTVRGTEFRDLVGTRAFFANLEYRFPLIDVFATPLLSFQGIRGVIFFDVGGAWYHDFEEFDFYNEDEGRLEDAIAAYGWGVTVRFFAGLDLNWDFAKQYDFDKSEPGFRTSFWIGTRF